MITRVNKTASFKVHSSLDKSRTEDRDGPVKCIKSETVVQLVDRPCSSWIPGIPNYCLTIG